jgi:hypothetical protein
VVTPEDPRFAELLERGEFEDPGAPEARRSVVVVEVERIADSCGYGVPLLAYEGQRPHMEAWAEKKLRVGGPEAIAAYRAEKNTTSIDGLPALGE